MGKIEVWIVPIGISELAERIKKFRDEEPKKTLSTFALLAEWKHFLENNRFAGKRHREETAFLRKFERQTRPHFNEKDWKRLRTQVLQYLAQVYAEEITVKTRT